MMLKQQLLFIGHGDGFHAQPVCLYLGYKIEQCLCVQSVEPPLLPVWCSWDLMGKKRPAICYAKSQCSNTQSQPARAISNTGPCTCMLPSALVNKACSESVPMRATGKVSVADSG